jgi:hypothetical protein
MPRSSAAGYFTVDGVSDLVLNKKHPARLDPQERISEKAAIQCLIAYYVGNPYLPKQSHYEAGIPSAQNVCLQGITSSI